MSVVSMKQLLEAGVHFGHQAKRWNPKMKKYIFTERNGIHVIDLHKSLKKIEEAYEEMRKIAEDGGKVLFVGTKKQAQEAIKEQAERSGMYYINNRWLGGMLTNFSTIKKRIERMKELEKMNRIISREIETGADETLLVLDATTGQNALVQAKQFKETIDVTGLILTKLDGTAKGGVILSIRHEMNIPVKFIGLGEKMDDLQPFDSTQFIFGLVKDSLK